MTPFILKPVCSVNGEIVLLGDKSIAHRAVILSALTSAETIIKNFPHNRDCFFTVSALRKLGVSITDVPGQKKVIVLGRGLYGLKEPGAPIFVGDSGTTLRIILGVLAGQRFDVTLRTGRFLSQRPMLRVTRPLRMMGAKIKSKVKRRVFGDVHDESKAEEYAPITISGGNPKAITYKMPVASAQVKSAILLAGLYAKGTTRVIEKFNTRDHTERMLKLFGADIKISRAQVSITGNRELKTPGKLYIPADVSSAAFFMVLAAIISNSRIILKKVGLNLTRAGVIDVLKRMGAKIKIKYQKSSIKYNEPMGDITVKSGRLKGTVVKKEEIPSLIDELPILMVAACLAEGISIFESAEELRVKETDRIKSMSENLKMMGADIRAVKKGSSENIIIRGVKRLKGGRLKSFGDHRTAMSMVVAALSATGNSRIDDIGCIDKSFPGFMNILKDIIPR